MWTGVAKAAAWLNEGRPVEALAALRPAQDRELGSIYVLVPLMTRARAHLAAGQATEAIAAYEKLLAVRSMAPATSQFPLAHLGLARAYAAAGRIAESRKAYEAFIAAWAGADQGQPLLAAARSELAKLREPS